MKFKGKHYIGQSRIKRLAIGYVRLQGADIGNAMSSNGAFQAEDPHKVNQSQSPTSTKAVKEVNEKLLVLHHFLRLFEWRGCGVSVGV